MVYLVFKVEYDKIAGKPIVSAQDESGLQKQIPLGLGLEGRLSAAIGRQGEITLKLKHSHGKINAQTEALRAEQCLLEATFVEINSNAEYGGTGRGDNPDLALLDSFLSALRQRQFLLDAAHYRNTLITTNVP